MNRYTIYCTEYQTKKALELGAPIDKIKHYASIGKYYVSSHLIYDDGICYSIPTAEQMINFLEEKHSLQFLTGIDDEDKFFFNIYHTEGYLEVRGCNSRQEATLAAIDAALDHLIQNKKQTHLTTTIMNYPINQKCIIRCTNAGVFFANIAEYDPTTNTAVLTDCRRIWYWSGAASLSQLATEGVKNPLECKFTVVVPSMVVTEVIEIIPCTDEAIENINAVSVWKM